MGNAIQSSGHGRVKIMKLDGEVTKVKEPVTVDEILKDYPGYVVLPSEAVRHMGVRAKPLDRSENLKAKHLYFLVELPKLENYQREPRRVRSGIQMNAKSRLESMLLARRSISDITIMNSSSSNDNNGASSSSEQGEDKSALRLKVRLSKTQLAKMMAESEDSSETAEKILESCLQVAEAAEKKEEEPQKLGNLPWKPALGSIPETCKKPQAAEGNRVKFRSSQQEEVF
uniref:Uncharacterized protein n=1 Tax=Araucaria cunninghamii TaxID=56994 RepID=A0A0D6QTL3_ARACU